ncbi:Aste57867_22065 [Aphanomyces stellatus]|uniref:Aste57867_22065 protein n=1 Tax=Aphanomyces stellatus TaxID=120398 RepID=A0A485LL91_9STRA|nr:hypothetical protein As57867_021996 [Aphanomyces stellatus]VFT98733.1 Aste57867_22065 [Aphanomyces stellatus]
MYAPYWMMQHLGIEEGGTIHLESALAVPKGLYCRFQPDQLEFLDLAAALGPKASSCFVLLESAMRQYSCLQLDGSLVLDYGDQKYTLHVVDIKPGPVVHLFGDVDLEVDFKAPENLDPRRPRSAIPRDASGMLKECTPQSTNTLASVDTPPVPTMKATSIAATSSSGIGRRLGDGGYVMEQPIDKPTSDDGTHVMTLPSKKDDKLSMKQAQAKALQKNETLDPLKFKAVRAFSTTGHSLTKNDQPQCESTTTSPSPTQTLVHNQVHDPPQASTTTTCTYCLADMPTANAELHMLRCKQNTTYHRFTCPTCEAHVLRSQEAQHIHCIKCPFVGSEAAVATHTSKTHTLIRCVCGDSVMQDAIKAHRASSCTHALLPCSICALSFKRNTFAAHYKACSSRTSPCEVCKAYINVLAFDAHVENCVDVCDDSTRVGVSKVHSQGPSKTTTSKTTSGVGGGFTCPYCNSKSTFPTLDALDTHTNNQCPIARSFKSMPVGSDPLVGGLGHPQKKACPPKQKDVVGCPTDNSSASCATPTLQKAGARVVRSKSPPVVSNQITAAFGDLAIVPIKGSTLSMRMSRAKQVDAVLTEARKQTTTSTTAAQGGLTPSYNYSKPKQPPRTKKL